MSVIHVNSDPDQTTTATPYDVTVKMGLLSNVGRLLSSLSESRKIAIVTDSNVAPIYHGLLESSLTMAGFKCVTAIIPAGEQNKTLESLLPVYNHFLGAMLERTTPIIALGGGIVGDMAGFVAATMLRGIPFIQIPTTLLAMVDASIGGKTGVNNILGKNLIGAFYDPIAVMIDPNVLTTLPVRELRSGLAECIKHDCIRGYGFDELESNIGRILSLDSEYITDLILHNIEIKSNIVEADRFERSIRAHLNFGHTFGHAIETVSSYRYSHGESVALGMTAASYVSKKLGLIDEHSRNRIVSLIDAAGLPTNNLNLDSQMVANAMMYDKKVESGAIRLILLDRIGHAIIRNDVPLTLIREAIDSLQPI